MTELLQTYWPAIVLALVVGLVIAWYVFRANRKTRVTGTLHDVLDEGAAPAERNRALIDSAPAATIDAAPKAPAPAAGKGDDLTRIKGLGPKLATTLGEMGISGFGQIAAWDDAEIDRIDALLGRFAGRIRRDRWVDQAALLARGDKAGFDAAFGNS